MHERKPLFTHINKLTNQLQMHERPWSKIPTISNSLSSMVQRVLATTTIFLSVCLLTWLEWKGGCSFHGFLHTLILLPSRQYIATCLRPWNSGPMQWWKWWELDQTLMFFPENSGGSGGFLGRMHVQPWNLSLIFGSGQQQQQHHHQSVHSRDHT